MEVYGIRGTPLKLISSFLTGRSQKVRVNGVLSSKQFIKTGLPTGSVLSCLLFLLYINDLPQLSQVFYPVLYADDTTLSFRGPSMDNLVQDVNEELIKFSQWTIANRLSVNTLKTFGICISNRVHGAPEIFFDGSEVNMTSTGKFLGITIDNRMCFSAHISELLSKISKSTGILYQLRKYLPTETLLSVYYSLIYPYFNYGVMIWGGTSASLLKPLEVMQKKMHSHNL